MQIFCLFTVPETWNVASSEQIFSSCIRFRLWVSQAWSPQIPHRLLYRLVSLPEALSICKRTDTKVFKRTDALSNAIGICRLAWTADKDPAYPSDILIRRTWSPYTLLCKSLPVTLNCLYQARVIGLDGGVLWYVVPKFRFDKPLSCVFNATDLFHKDRCSSVENIGCYHLPGTRWNFSRSSSRRWRSKGMSVFSYKSYSRVNL